MIHWRRGLARVSCCLDQRFFHRSILPRTARRSTVSRRAPSDVFAQRVVDQRLIVAATCAIHGGLKMLDNVIVEPDRDSCLSGSRRHHWASPSLAEIVLPLHRCLLVLRLLSAGGCAGRNASDASPANRGPVPRCRGLAEVQLPELSYQPRVMPHGRAAICLISCTKNRNRSHSNSIDLGAFSVR